MKQTSPHLVVVYTSNVVVFVVGGLEEEESLVPFDLNSKLLFVTGVAVDGLY